jgi:thymidine phosphorylase
MHVTAKPARSVAAGEPLATIMARTEEDAAAAGAALARAIEIGDERTEPLPLVGERIA